MKALFAWSFMVALLGVCASRTLAQTQKECSTEKVNDNCTVTFDLSYPVTMPTIQMGRKKKVDIVVVNALPFEVLTLDPQSAQAVAGTDQTAGFLTAALPNIKAFVGSVDLKGLAEVQVVGLAAGSTDSPEVVKVKGDLKDLEDILKAPSTRIAKFFDNATTVYLQLQEILSPLPRPFNEGAETPVRVPEVVNQGTPNPWVASNYPAWRKLLLCELNGGYCDTSYNSFRDILDEANLLQSGLAALAPPPPPPSGKPLFDSAAFDVKAQAIQTEITALAGDQAIYQKELDRLKMWKAALVASVPSYVAAITTITKDWGGYFVNISQTVGTSCPSAYLGEIHDPQVSSKLGACAKNLVGCQVTFSVNALNEVGTFRASIPSATQKKSIATITIIYADPKFEVSAGAFFSTLPDRSFANQTTVTQNPGAAPTPGNVVISQTIQRPTIVPFAAANFRLGPEYLWPDGRRGAFYLTTAIGLNPYNTTAEFGIGPSISWRSIMFSGLLHVGHDVRLTQGESVGEVWCNQSAASGSIPKCSGSPPGPSTEKYWKVAFAFGISVRVPTVFGGGAGAMNGSSH